MGGNKATAGGLIATGDIRNVLLPGDGETCKDLWGDIFGVVSIGDDDKDGVMTGVVMVLSLSLSPPPSSSLVSF